MSAIRPSTHIDERALSDRALDEAIDEGEWLINEWAFESERRAVEMRLEDLKAERLRRHQLPKPLTVVEQVERARRAQLKHERRIPVQLELEGARA